MTQGSEKPAPLTLAEFEAHVEATERTEDGRRGGLDYALLKLCAEAGEVAQLRAREILGGDKMPEDAVARRMSEEQLARRALYALELGDAAWYLTEAARLLGLTLEQVLELNVMKLCRRRAKNVRGEVLGKDPAGEQAVAEVWLADPMHARHARRMIAAWRSGVPVAENAPAIPATFEEFEPCSVCGDWTRHRADLQSIHGAGTPLCKAPECQP